MKFCLVQNIVLAKGAAKKEFHSILNVQNVMISDNLMGWAGIIIGELVTQGGVLNARAITFLLVISRKNFMEYPIP